MLVSQPKPAIPNAAGKYRASLVMLTTLFFMWGLMTSLNDVLIPHLRNAFALNYTQGMLVQFCFFGAYFIVSIPAGRLLERIGYKKGIVTGLVIAGIGCLMFYPAASILSYSLFLAALFILASGITILQVSANPYVSALGNPATASSRLTMTQAFNSLGTTVGPLVGGILILGAAGSALPGADELLASGNEARSVQLPYLLLGLMFFAVAVFFTRINLPRLQIEHSRTDKRKDKSAWAFRHLVLGAIGIFVYVGAEVSVGSFLINYLGQPEIAGLGEKEASTYVAYFWGGAMIGRFLGAFVMQKVEAGKLLGFNAVVAGVLLLVAMFAQGSIAMWAIISIGMFNSIMFPTIFSLAVNGLQEYTSEGSGILCLFIVGGAILPVFQGVIADTFSIQASFWIPVACYLYILFYGLKGSKIGAYN